MKSLGISVERKQLKLRWEDPGQLRHQIRGAGRVGCLTEQAWRSDSPESNGAPRSNCLTSEFQCPHLQNEDKISWTSLRGLNRLEQVKCLAHCLAHNKCLLHGSDIAMIAVIIISVENVEGEQSKPLGEGFCCLYFIMFLPL